MTLGKLLHFCMPQFILICRVGIVMETTSLLGSSNEHSMEREYIGAWCIISSMQVLASVIIPT